MRKAKRALVVSTVAGQIRSGEAEPGYHSTCAHGDGPEELAECGVRRWEVEECLKAGRELVGRALLGFYSHVSAPGKSASGSHLDGRGTYTRAEPKENRQEAKRRRVRERKAAAGARRCEV